MKYFFISYIYKDKLGRLTTSSCCGEIDSMSIVDAQNAINEKLWESRGMGLDSTITPIMFQKITKLDYDKFAEYNKKLLSQLCGSG
jgi:hypothetical protein